MSQAVCTRGFWMEFIYIYRAIFACIAVNGISLPFFSNLIANIKQ
ncbi:RAxF-45 family protein [Bacillus sp. S/N-304-OC-R1]|nr:RAxF-45 family protein [Bacillus sp. S/N-304-OC-R1]